MIKVLGVYIDNRLTFNHHVNEILKSCYQSLFARKTMKNYGLNQSILETIFKSLILSKLLYASSAWWGFRGQQNKLRYSAFLRKAVKYGYYSSTDPDIDEMQKYCERKLFDSIILNEHHVLHDLLPPTRVASYSLRPRRYNFVLPIKDDRNFLARALYAFI